MELIEGIVIAYSKYKDNDTVFNILTKNSLQTALGIGSEKFTNKINKLRRSFLYGEFDLYKGPTNTTKIRDCKIYNDFSSKFKNLEDLMILDFLTELTFKCLIENDEYLKYFDTILNVLNNYDSQYNTKYMLILYYFATILKINGVQPAFRNCIECGSSNVSGFDILRGGVVCNEHFSPSTIDCNDENFDILSNIFTLNIDEIKDIALDWNKFKEILNHLYNLFVFSFNVKLNSINTINTL